MFQIPLATSSSFISPHNYWKTIILYHNRPNLINRKIAAASQVLFYEVEFNSKSIHLQDLINCTSILYELRKLPKVTAENIKKDFLINLLESYDKKVKLKETCINDLKNDWKGRYVSVRILFPRLKNHPNAIEVVTFDKEHGKATFLAVSDTEKLLVGPPFPYQIELTPSLNLKINVNDFDDADTPQAEWLSDKLFMKLLKWAENCDNNGEQNVQSLSLIKVDEYCLTYNRLKVTYGDKLVQKWPEKAGTDPQKYVFEDIAITSYLICLWKNETNIKFVDCGCGNGLLVYLLNQEGYGGYGIDVRRRSIWDIYPKSTRLEVGIIGPDSLFPDSTWLIGNHSDELTPWIPVIALKTSQLDNFFVLPCCPYDFNGRKFIRKNTSVSAYADYLTYIEDICSKCGFKTDVDKLRIPSTKRTCVVGRRKQVDAQIQAQILENVSKLVGEKISENFVQRSNNEKVRNCTQVDKSLIADIVSICVNKLLSVENNIKKANGEFWNQGCHLQISDLVQAVPSEKLKQIKQECGGLQTLLRNHRYLFEVTKGSVNLRQPVNIKATSKYKEKPCWFSKNHPDGCLFSNNDCGYKHE